MLAYHSHVKTFTKHRKDTTSFPKFCETLPGGHPIDLEDMNHLIEILNATQNSGGQGLGTSTRKARSRSTEDGWKLETNGTMSLYYSLYDGVDVVYCEKSLFEWAEREAQRERDSGKYQLEQQQRAERRATRPQAAARLSGHHRHAIIQEARDKYKASAREAEMRGQRDAETKGERSKLPANSIIPEVPETWSARGPSDMQMTGGNQHSEPAFGIAPTSPFFAGYTPQSDIYRGLPGASQNSLGSLSGTWILPLRQSGAERTELVVGPWLCPPRTCRVFPLGGSRPRSISQPSVRKPGCFRKGRSLMGNECHRASSAAHDRLQLQCSRAATSASFRRAMANLKRQAASLHTAWNSLILP